MRSNPVGRVLALVLAVCLCFTAAFSMAAVPAEAKAAPKLSAKSVKIAMGGTKKITLKNASKGKWSIEDNGVAVIKKKARKYATVKPLKAGTATLTCKAGGKTLKCKVRVLNNRIGKTPSLDQPDHFAVIAGEPMILTAEVDKGIKSISKSYDKTKARVTSSYDASEHSLTIKVRVKEPGLFILRLNYKYSDGRKASDDLRFVAINGFRGSESVKRTAGNYRKWRKKTISSMVSADMTTWEIVDAIGTLISSGKYSGTGGVSGKQLWYGGNGTCISGAQMMNDFMKDIGISSKIHFMGRSKGPTDIYGYKLSYASQHKNTWIRLGGKRYELNPEPASSWPIGIVKR